MDRQTEWKIRVQELFQVCQDELKRTTEIGKRMLSASRTNSELHDAYEELGRIVVNEMKNNRLDWKNARVDELMEVIGQCENDLANFETEVNRIKFSAGPEDISKVPGKAAEVAKTKTDKK